MTNITINAHVTPVYMICGRELFLDSSLLFTTNPQRLTCMLPMDDVQGAIWCARVLQQLGQEHGASWDALGRLHQVRVAAHHPDGEHPQRNHGGEVEGGDAGADAERQAVRVRVHVLGDGGQGFAQHEGGDAAGVLHHL